MEGLTKARPYGVDLTWQHLRRFDTYPTLGEAQAAAAELRAMAMFDPEKAGGLDAGYPLSCRLWRGGKDVAAICVGAWEYHARGAWWDPVWGVALGLPERAGSVTVAGQPRGEDEVAAEPRPAAVAPGASHSGAGADLVSLAWFSLPSGNLIGVVLLREKTYWKAYIGLADGLSERVDMDQIMRTGTRFHREAAEVLMGGPELVAGLEYLP